MTDNLLHEIESYLTDDREDRAGLEYLQRLGTDGVERLLRQIEADYRRAADAIELSGRDVARVTLLAHLIASAADVTSPEGRETMARLVQIGWVMARWYKGD